MFGWYYIKHKFNKLNNILPPFVNHGVLGLNLGMQGVQFTATSTTAENQMLSNPILAVFLKLVAGRCGSL